MYLASWLVSLVSVSYMCDVYVYVYIHIYACIYVYM